MTTEQAAQSRMVTGAGASHTHASRGDDFYQTPRVAIDHLLAHPALAFDFRREPIWEPAAGLGAISLPLAAAGFDVISTDLVDRGFGTGGVDFLAERTPRARRIVSNPPYKAAAAFIQHALNIGVVESWWLLRLAFLESEGRRDLLQSGHLREVHVCTNRLPMMHRADWSGPRVASGGVPFAWFRFCRQTGPTLTTHTR